MKKGTSRKTNACDPPLQGGARAVGTRARVRNMLLPPEASGGGPLYNLRRRGTTPRMATTENDTHEPAVAKSTAKPLHPMEDNDNDSTSEDDAGPIGLPANEVKTEKRSRFKWSNDMNTQLYRTYLLITRMETLKTPYSRQLHQDMIQKFPELENKTIQNILDQRRQLFTKNRLTPEEIERIRRDVAQELGIIITTPNTDQGQHEDRPKIITEEEQKAQDSLKKNLLLYSGMDPSSRPNIPRLKSDSKTNHLIKIVDNALKQLMPECNNLAEYHDKIYAAAITILELHNQQIENKNPGVQKKGKPAWETRLANKINYLRKDIGIITQYINNPTTSNKVKKKATEIIERNKNEVNNSPKEIMDLLKQKLKIVAHRLRSHRESYQRRVDNNNFDRSQRMFYRELKDKQQDKPNAEANQYPDENETKEFWSRIWESPAQHKKSANWIRSEKQKTSRVNQMPPQPITKEDVKKVLTKAPNWRSPGPDKVQNFWFKKFTSTHERMAELFTDVLSNPEHTPDFLTKGITYLLPKTSPSLADPSKYRPITCLPTLYKFITGIITEKIYQHLETNNLLTEEQKGCRKNARGCSEQLVIDTVITREAIKMKKELHIAYIDYQKAFDSIPHSWLIECLSIYKICPTIIRFLQEMMNKWETNLLTNNNNTQRRSNPLQIKIKRGIFQGDALSALWFCLAINPLTNALNKKGNGYILESKNKEIEVTHLMYMDDIKIFSSDAKGLKRSLRITEEFSSDIRMNFGLDKCKTNSIKNGKWKKSEDYRMLQRTGGGTIQSMDKNEQYKYLGYAQTIGIKDAEVKQLLIAEMESRLKAILKTKLSAINMAKAVNTYAAPVITSSFGVIKWTSTDLEEVNRSIRVAFTRSRLHHPRASKERFHLPRSMGGRGIMDMHESQEHQIQNLRKYFHQKAQNSPLHAAVAEADNNLTPLRLATHHIATNEDYTRETQMNKWKAKELHGRYINNINQTCINKQASLSWLVKGNLFPETEGFLCAIQDQVIPTKAYKKHIMKDNSIQNTNCRMCGEHNETIEHITNGCTTLAPKEYTNRHNNVAKIVHREICLRFGILNTTTAYYKYTPESVQENERCLIYWDRTILTHRTVQHNRPDIFIQNKEDNSILIIDIAIPAPVNIPKKTTEKREKYFPLAEDIKEVWRASKVQIIPIIIGSTGEVSSNLFENLEILGLKKNTYLEMQKAAILGTCNTVRKVLNRK